MRKLFSVYVLLFVLMMPSASADIFDPAPLFHPAESPPGATVFPLKTQDFFCPLFKQLYNDPEKIMAETLMMEALGEGYEGMVAVGEVIRRRSKFFSKDFASVCLMPRQFSCWNDGKRAKEFLEKYKDHYFIALMAWRESERTSLTAGATDYHAASVRPYWADAYRVAARVGRHIFYIRR